MTIKPRTVDNLGIDASIRYAKDKELFEANLIEESHFVAQKTSIPVTKPYVPSEFDQLFAVGKALRWATFAPLPEHLMGYERPLFSFQLIPSLGGYEKQEEDEDKISLLEDELDKRRGNKEGGKEGGQEQEERDLQTIAKLLACIRDLDKSLTIIQTRRNQYQRG